MKSLAKTTGHFLPYQCFAHIVQDGAVHPFVQWMNNFKLLTKLFKKSLRNENVENFVEFLNTEFIQYILVEPTYYFLSFSNYLIKTCSNFIVVADLLPHLLRLNQGFNKNIQFT